MLYSVIVDSCPVRNSREAYTRMLGTYFVCSATSRSYDVSIGCQDLIAVCRMRECRGTYLHVTCQKPDQSKGDNFVSLLAFPK